MIPARLIYPVMYPCFPSSYFLQILSVERKYRVAEEMSAQQDFVVHFRNISRADFQEFLHNVGPMGYVDQLGSVLSFLRSQQMSFR